MPRKNKLSASAVKPQSPKYKVGSVVMPKYGSENGIYIVELQSERPEKQQVFVSPRVIQKSGKKTTDYKNGQLVRYKVNQEIPSLSLVEEIAPLLGE